MQRVISFAWAIGPLAVVLAQVSIFSGCMSLRHKVDPVSITLNVKLENVDQAVPPTMGSASSTQNPTKLAPEAKSP